MVNTNEISSADIHFVKILMDNVLFGQLGEIRKGKDAGNGKKVMRRFSSYISKKLS